jgi:copper chaperone
MFAAVGEFEEPKPRLETIMETLSLSIQGMSCGGCVGKVTAALKSIPSTTVEQVAVGSARVQFDPKKTTDSALIAAVNKVGFQAAKA